VAQGVPGMLRPRIFLTFRHYKGGRSSAKRTVRLYPRRNPWYSFSESESTSGHMVLSGVPRKKFPVTPSGIDPGTVCIADRINLENYQLSLLSRNGHVCHKRKPMLLSAPQCKEVTSRPTLCQCNPLHTVTS